LGTLNSGNWHSPQKILLSFFPPLNREDYPIVKNILNEIPSDRLHGRALFASHFCSTEDLRSKVVLNIGCGFGWFELIALKTEVKTLISIEKSFEELKTAATALISSPIKFGVSDGRRLPFKDKSFDTVVSWDVIEHIPKRTEPDFFREARRVLKNEGVFYLSTPYASIFSNLFDPAWWLIGHRHYSKKKLVGLAEQSGFILKKMWIGGRWWNIAGIVNMYAAKWIFRRKPFFEAVINTRTDNEFGRAYGFVALFAKLNKI
jgi:SAM-dependent methyltransferase